MRSALFRTVIANLVGPMSTLLAAPILAQGLGASARGELAAATMPLTLVAASLTLGLPESLTFHLAKGRVDYTSARNRTLLALSLTGVLGALILLVSAPLLSGGNLKVTDLIAFSSIFAIPSVVMWTLRGLSQGMQLWSRLNREKMLVGGSRLVTIIVLLACNALTLESVFIAYMLSPLVGFLAYINLKRSAKSGDFSNNDHVSTRTILQFGMRVWWGSLAGILLTRLDQVLMLSVSTESELGFYSAAATVADIPLIVTAAVSTILLSRESSSPNVARATQASRLTFLLVLLCVAFAGATSLWWFPLAFGEEFRPALPTLIILLIAMACTAPSSVAGSFMTAKGKPSARSISLFAGLAVNVALFFLFVPASGAIGAATATAGGQLVVVFFNLIQMRIHYGIRISEMIFPNKKDLNYLRILSRETWEQIHHKITSHAKK